MRDAARVGAACDLTARGGAAHARRERASTWFLLDRILARSLCAYTLQFPSSKARSFWTTSGCGRACQAGLGSGPRGERTGGHKINKRVSLKLKSTWPLRLGWCPTGVAPLNILFRALRPKLLNSQQLNHKGEQPQPVWGSRRHICSSGPT